MHHNNILKMHLKRFQPLKKHMMMVPPSRSWYWWHHLVCSLVFGTLICIMLHLVLWILLIQWFPLLVWITTNSTFVLYISSLCASYALACRDLNPRPLFLGIFEFESVDATIELTLHWHFAFCICFITITLNCLNRSRADLSFYTKEKLVRFSHFRHQSFPRILCSTSTRMTSLLPRQTLTS